MVVESFGGGVVLMQPRHQASSRLVVVGPACLQQRVLGLTQMPLHRSLVAAWLLRRPPRRPLVAEPARASHPCLPGDLRDPVDLVEAGSGSTQEGQWAC
jgi:hypothetical protein